MCNITSSGLSCAACRGIPPDPGGSVQNLWRAVVNPDPERAGPLALGKLRHGAQRHMENEDSRSLWIVQPAGRANRFANNGLGRLWTSAEQNGGLVCRKRLPLDGVDSSNPPRNA